MSFAGIYDLGEGVVDLVNSVVDYGLEYCVFDSEKEKVI